MAEQELTEVAVELEEPDVSPEDFVKMIYDLAKEAMRREIGIFPDDFLFNMIHTRGFWWMPSDHHVALMLVENGHLEEASMRGHLGHLVVYSDASVKACRDSLVEKAKEFGLLIKSPLESGDDK